MDTLKKMKKPLVFGAAVAFLTFAVGMIIYYIIWPSAAFFHADCSDTILWAQASYDSKSLFNPDFGYAATLPFGGTMLMVPFIGIFGVSMTTQHIGMVLFALLMLASFFLLCRSIGMSVPSSLFTVGVTGLTLCASEKLREIFYEHVIYYSICVVIIAVLLSLVIRFEDALSQGNKKKAIVLAALAAVFAACSALDGMQIVATGILPVIFAVVADIILDKDKKIFSAGNRNAGIVIAAAAVGTAVGMLLFASLSNGAGVGYANAYSSYANMDEWLSNLGKFPQEWFALFGVDAHYGMGIFTPESIVNIIRLGVSVIILIVPIFGLIFMGRLDRRQRYAVFAHFGLSAVIMFGYIFGILSAANWRLSPMICTGIFASAATFTGLRKSRVSVRFEAITACLLALLSLVSTVTIAKMDSNGIVNNEKYQLISVLEAYGLDYGYATFWNSQVITVLSDSEVRAANIDVNEKGIAPCRYQANMKWFEDQEGVDRYFVLLSDSEVETLRATEDWALFDALVTDEIKLDNWTIYLFDSTAFLD